jgi:NAD(P)-dependent dehydrogenase (short-subunit alcohol dehydrogenase family)
MELLNKVAIVTGGISGIGAAISERFAEAGATVVAADIAGDPNRTPAGSNGRIVERKVDVSDAVSVENLVTDVLSKFGAVDILVNSAGVAQEIPFLDTTIETFDRIVAINLRGSFLMGQAVARSMVERGSGRIINIASVSGRRANYGRAAYGASKGGLVLLSEVMAIELAPHGVLVNVIAPGPIETPMVAQVHNASRRESWITQTPIGRYGKPNEIANAALFLASDASTYVVGHVLNVDGGFMAGGLIHSQNA